MVVRYYIRSGEVTPCIMAYHISFSSESIQRTLTEISYGVMFLLNHDSHQVNIFLTKKGLSNPSRDRLKSLF